MSAKEKSNNSSGKNFMIRTFVICIILCAVSIILYINFKKEWLFSTAIAFGTVSYHFLIRFLSPVILYLFFHKRYNYNNAWFRQKKWEPELYKHLKVKKWKSSVFTYDPDEFSFKKHSVEEIVNNMCHAEAVHELIIVLGYTSLLFSIPFGSFAVFLITAIIAGMIDSVFVILQRYNRPRIKKLIKN